jgi:hypothetical protein
VGAGPGLVILALLLAFLLRVLAGLRASLHLSRWGSSAASVLAHSDICFYLVNLHCHLSAIYLLFTAPVGRLGGWAVGRAWDLFAIYLPSLRHLPAIYGLSTRFGWVEGRAWDISTVYLTSIQLLPLIYPAIYLLSTCHILPYIIIYCHLSSGRVVGRAWDIFAIYPPSILPFICHLSAISLPSLCHLPAISSTSICYLCSIYSLWLGGRAGLGHLYHLFDIYPTFTSNLSCHLPTIYLSYLAIYHHILPSKLWTGGWAGLGHLCHLPAIYFVIYLDLLPSTCHLLLWFGGWVGLGHLQRLSAIYSAIYSVIYLAFTRSDGWRDGPGDLCHLL